jgi:Icc-related predicted phosphoesterase
VASSFFVSDLHGDTRKCRKLFAAIAAERPEAVFIGGDILPPFGLPGETSDASGGDFLLDFLAKNIRDSRSSASPASPRVFLILGNDDARVEEEAVEEAASEGAWEYVHGRKTDWKDFSVYGYSYVPPTPFARKDWERYDISRYVDPGSVSPEEGLRSVPVSDREARLSTIKEDLARLTEGRDLSRAIFLFHAPPYRTRLDVSSLAGKSVDHVPLDHHLGSIAIRRFIEARQPLLTLHGHVHEAARLSGSWRDRIGRTECLSAAHDGPELALVRFDPAEPGAATRELV